MRDSLKWRGYIEKNRWTSLVVQGLRFHAANTGGEDLILVEELSKILHATWHSQKIKRKKKM